MGIIKNAFNNILFTYPMSKEVRIRSATCGFLYRLIQLGIFCVYAVGYSVFYKNAYLEFDYVEATTTTKMQGIVHTDFPDHPGLSDRIWDAADYVVPPLEYGAKFVMTNIVVTQGQRQGICEEDPSVEEARCDNTTCTAGEQVDAGHGIFTGVCLDSTRLPGAKVCQVQAWCPVERDDETTRTSTPAFLQSKNFSLFVKNSVYFPKFDLRSRNIHSDVTPGSYLSSCRYNPDDEQDRRCPVFGLDTIVRLAGHSYEDVAVEGGVFQIVISWRCESSDIDNCWPTYSFKRLDRGDHRILRGFHFRFADHWENGTGTLVRTLYKATGIRLIVSVDGYATKPDIWNAIITAGSCFGSLAAAAFVCEHLVHLFGCSFYSDVKYDSDHDDVDAFQNLTCGNCCCRIGSKIFCSSVRMTSNTSPGCHFCYADSMAVMASFTLLNLQAPYRPPRNRAEVGMGLNELIMSIYRTNI